jgi:RimJ/RimL family protein N-acetyltransferase
VGGLLSRDLELVPELAACSRGLSSGPCCTPRYPIETTRLHLRPLVETDFEDFYAYDSSPEVARYLYWEPRGPAESREAFERHLRRTALEGEGDALVLATVWREVGKVVGHVSLG